MDSEIPTYNQNVKSENVEALLYEVQNKLAQDYSENCKVQQSLLKSYLKRVKFLRADKIEKMEKRLEAGDVKNKLSKRLAELSTVKDIEGAKKWVKSLFTSLKDTTGKKDRQNKRLLHILDEIDEGKSDIVQDNRENAIPLKTIANGAGAVGDALKSQIKLKYDSEKQENLHHLIQSKKGEDAIDHQKGAIQAQLEALKKSKLFGKLFKVFGIITSAVVTALTAGAGSPLGLALQSTSKFIQIAVPALIQSAYGSLMQGLQALGMKPIQTIMMNSQLYAHNAAQDYQKMLRKIIGNESDFQKSRSKNEDVIDNLQNSQFH